MAVGIRDADFLSTKPALSVLSDWIHSAYTMAEVVASLVAVSVTNSTLSHVMEGERLFNFSDPYLFNELPFCYSVLFEEEDKISLALNSDSELNQFKVLYPVSMICNQRLILRLIFH
jgi:hypothetical protein